MTYYIMKPRKWMVSLVVTCVIGLGALCYSARAGSDGAKINSFESALAELGRIPKKLDEESICARVRRIVDEYSDNVRGNGDGNTTDAERNAGIRDFNNDPCRVLKAIGEKGCNIAASADNPIVGELIAIGSRYIK